MGEKSDTLSIQFGVPQGSILGPLLFLLYMNDITNSSKLGSFVTFADDTNIFVVGKTKREAYERGNRLLSSLQSYMRANKLHINMSKCCYIHFKPPVIYCIITIIDTNHYLEHNCSQAQAAGLFSQHQPDQINLEKSPSQNPTLREPI